MSFFCWLSASLMVFLDQIYIYIYITEETWRTLVAIMLCKKVDIGGGQLKQTCSLFPLLKQHLLSRRCTDCFWTDAVLIGTSQPSCLDSETGRKTAARHLDGFLVEREVGGGCCCPNSTAFCTNMLRRIPIFHPVSPLRHCSPSPATPWGKKWPWM